jgi:hypothetical protein
MSAASASAGHPPPRRPPVSTVRVHLDMSFRVRLDVEVGEGELLDRLVVSAILRLVETNLPSRRMAAHDRLAGAMDGTAVALATVRLI